MGVGYFGVCEKTEQGVKSRILDVVVRGPRVARLPSAFFDFLLVQSGIHVDGVKLVDELSIRLEFPFQEFVCLRAHRSGKAIESSRRSLVRNILIRNSGSHTCEK